MEKSKQSSAFSFGAYVGLLQSICTGIYLHCNLAEMDCRQCANKCRDIAVECNRTDQRVGWSGSWGVVGINENRFGDGIEGDGMSGMADLFFGVYWDSWIF